jgi:hypothetical protein
VAQTASAVQDAANALCRESESKLLGLFCLKAEKRKQERKEPKKKDGGERMGEGGGADD